MRKRLGLCLQLESCSFMTVCVCAASFNDNLKHVLIYHKAAGVTCNFPFPHKCEQALILYMTQISERELNAERFHMFTCQPTI